MLQAHFNEFENTPFCILNGRSKGYKEVICEESKICIISSSSLSVYEKCKSSNRIKDSLLDWDIDCDSDLSYILSCLWLDKNILFVVTNSKTNYVIEIKQNLKESYNIIRIPFYIEDGVDIITAETIIFKKEVRNANDISITIGTLINSEQFYIITINQTENSIDYILGNNIRLNYPICKLLRYGEGFIGCSEKHIQKYIISMSNQKVILEDLYYFGELFSINSLDFNDLIFLSATITFDQGFGNELRIIVKSILDQGKQNLYELVFTCTDIYLVNFSNFIIDNVEKILNIEYFKTSDEYKLLATFDDVVEIIDNPMKNSFLHRKRYFENISTNFLPHIYIENSNFSSYISCGKLNDTSKWGILRIEHQLNSSSTTTNCDSLEYQTFDSPGNIEKLKTIIQKFIEDSPKIDTFVPKLMQVFSKLLSITDDETILEYICNVVKKIDMHSSQSTRELLCSTLELLNSLNNDGTNRNTFILQELIHKLSTFDILYDISSNSQEIFDIIFEVIQDCKIINKNSTWFSKWSKFMSINLVHVSMYYLSQNLIEEFFTVYERHCHNFGNGDADKRNQEILELLSNIPINLPLKYERKLPHWLSEQVIPYIQDRERFLNWLADRAIALEHHKNGDLNSCLYLLSCIYENNGYLRCGYNQDQILLPKQVVENGIFWAGSGDRRYFIKRLASNRINYVNLALLECIDIKEKYNLNISFNLVLHKQITPMDIVYELLNRVTSSEFLEDEIKYNIKPFCKLRGIDCDKILLDYIQDLILASNSSENSLNLSSYESKNHTKDREVTRNISSNIKQTQKYYQPRIITLIECLSNDEYKACALLQYLTICGQFAESSISSTNSNVSGVTNSSQSRLEKLINDSKSWSLDDRKVLELRNRVALREAQNLLSRYHLDQMASIVLFERGAPRRLLNHILAQIDFGIESYNDAIKLIKYLGRETGVSFMTVNEACCLRLRFIVFNNNRISQWTENKNSNDLQLKSDKNSLEKDLLDLFNLISNLNDKLNITQQFVCFIWQFLDFILDKSNTSQALVKCEIAIYSGIFLLRVLLKNLNSSNKKYDENAYWVSREVFNSLVRLQHLHEEFNLYIRPSDIMIMPFDREIDGIYGNKFLNNPNQDNEVEIETSLTINSNPYFARKNDNFSQEKNEAMKTKYKNWEWKNNLYHLNSNIRHSNLCRLFDSYAEEIAIKYKNNGRSKGILTSLLRLGKLIGVGESYVRKSLIRYSAADNNCCIFQCLIQELVKTPSPKTALIIVDEVQNIILKLSSNFRKFNPNMIKMSINEDFSNSNPIYLVFTLAKLLHILATCIPYCATSVLSVVLAFSGDILWVQDFLLQASDLMDCIHKNKSKFYEIIHEKHNIFSQIIYNTHINKRTFIKISDTDYNEICTLYSYYQAISISLNFLSSKIQCRKELAKNFAINQTHSSSLLLLNARQEPGWWSSCEYNESSNNSDYILSNLSLQLSDLISQLYQLECLSLAMNLSSRHPALIKNIPSITAINADYFRKVLKGKDPMDGQLCMTLASTLDKKESWNVFVQSLIPSNILDNYFRAQRMARIGWDLGILFNHYSMRKEMEELHKHSKWCNYFRLYGIQFDQSLFFQKQDPKNIQHMTYQKSIVPLLIYRSSFDLFLCLQYARDYMIHDEYVVSLWIEKLLLYVFDERYQNMMANLASCISPTIGKEVFDRLLGLISSYDYERINFILSWYKTYILNSNSMRKFEINSRAIKGINQDCSVSNDIISTNTKTQFSIPIESQYQILQVLMGYNRVGEMDDEEERLMINEINNLKRKNADFWDESIETTIRIKSKKRLPFHYLINDPWKVLKNEICDNTIYSLKKLATYLNIQLVHFDIQLVWNIVLDRKSQHKKLTDFNQPEVYSLNNHLINYTTANDETSNTDNILLSYIDSIASFDIEMGLATVLLIIDELPLTITTLKLLEWSETKINLLDNVELSKGLPKSSLSNSNDLNYGSISNIDYTIKNRKSLTRSLLILQRYRLDEIFGNILTLTNDAILCIHCLYYYLTPIISEGIHKSLPSYIQLAIRQSFCSLSSTNQNLKINGDDSILSSNYSTASLLMMGLNLSNKFHSFIDELCNAYCIDAKKTRINLVKNILNKPNETPYSAVKIKYAHNVKDLFEKIESSGIMESLNYWYPDSAKNKNENMHIIDKSCIDRIAFICNGISLNDAILLLLSISFKNSTNYSYAIKCRALNVLFQIASTKSIQKRYPKYSDLKVIWLHNFYMEYCQQLHIPQDFSKFYLSEKTGLARSLWREYKNHQKTKYIQDIGDIDNYMENYYYIGSNKLRCIDENEHNYIQHTSTVENISNSLLYLLAPMCTDFNITDSSLFANITEQLYLNSKSDLYSMHVLSSLLSTIYNSGYIYSLPLNDTLISTWQLLICNPYKQLTSVIEDHLVHLWHGIEDKKTPTYFKYDIELYFKIPIQCKILSILSEFYLRCPIIPFLDINQIIDVNFEFMNILIKLMNFIKKSRLSDANMNYSDHFNLLISNTVIFFKNLENIINSKFIAKENESELYNLEDYIRSENNCPNNNSKYCLSICESVLLIISSHLMKLVDIKMAAYKSTQNNTSNYFMSKLDFDNTNLLIYFTLTTRSNNLLSLLVIQIINKNLIPALFEVENKFSKESNIIDVNNYQQATSLYCIDKLNLYDYIFCHLILPTYTSIHAWRD
ncbi:hypothetical protein cand_000410 [Cryptosporidium andersoni]|uniref:KNTC1 third ARM-repeats domain-containing protein n=1 Tax=Cryptosporidium andersoni TaxID=117008 RepID=A0A1J4MQP8_9CRYT|nr:hypothetical protein cand_000410 [Cryptosporidium andersoni]